MSSLTTNGWDVVLASSYTNVNSQVTERWPDLIKQSPSLAEIKASASTKTQTVSLDITMSAWQITQGGNGNLVRMQLPIIGDSSKFYGMMADYDLSGQSITVEIELSWVPQPGQINFSIISNYTEIVKDLESEPTVTDNIVQAFISSSSKVTLSTSATIKVLTHNVSWKIADPTSATSYYLYVTTTGGTTDTIEVYEYVTNSLVAANQGTAIHPVVVISGPSNVTDQFDGALLQEMIDQNIDSNMGAFNFVFATVDVMTQLAENDVWSWLQPTVNQYAVAEPTLNKTNDNCLFGVMSMVANREPPATSSPQVDAGAIPADSDGGLLISQYLFLQNMLLPGVVAAFDGASAADFTVDEAAGSIKNANKVTLASVQLPNSDGSDDGETVSLDVAPNNFSVNLYNTRVKMEFTDLGYPLTSFGMTMGQIKIMFDGQYELTLKTSADQKNQTLWFTVPQDQTNGTNVTATMNETYYTVEEAMGYVSAALSVLGLTSELAATVTEYSAANSIVKAGVVEMDATTEQMQAAFQTLLTDPATFTRDASADALEMLGSATTKLKAVKIWGFVAKIAGTLASLTGLVYGIMAGMAPTLQEAAVDNWDKTPSFVNFVELAIDRYTFAGLKGESVVSAGLAGPLQIGFSEEKTAPSPLPPPPAPPADDDADEGQYGSC